MRVQCPATVMANDSFFDTNSISGKSVSLTGRLITLKKRISITFCCCCCYIQVYLPMQDLNYFALEKKCDVSLRARNSMLSRPFAADECFSSISYFIFLYTQFTVKKLNVGHKKENTE